VRRPLPADSTSRKRTESATQVSLRVKNSAFADFDEVLESRRQDADEFYADLQRSLRDEDAKSVQRQALAGMIWSKQYFYYDVRQWLKGDRPSHLLRLGVNMVVTTSGTI
jgi:hypothetical protein